MAVAQQLQPGKRLLCVLDGGSQSGLLASVPLRGVRNLDLVSASASSWDQEEQQKSAEPAQSDQGYSMDSWASIQCYIISLRCCGVYLCASVP